MAAAKTLTASLELAGISCKEFSKPLQQACADSNCVAVLDWLTAQISDGVLSDNQVALLQRSNAEHHEQTGADSARAAELDRLITATEQEQHSQSLLQPSASEQQLNEIIADQEASLLQFQAQIRSLQALSSKITRQTGAPTHLKSAATRPKTQTKSRLASNAHRLTSQQNALNTLLAEIQKTVASLQAKFAQQRTSWLLALSDLQALHQQDAAFQAELDR